MKTKIEILRQQHDAAEQIAASIMSLVRSYRDADDAPAIASLIGKLNALLRVHLAYEDTILYPSLIRSGDGEAAALALQFLKESGSLAPQFEEFVRRWSGPSIIAAMFDLFRVEATSIFAALASRIERENNLLYPLAERVARPQAA